MSETRKITAILCSDVVGYSRLAGADEDRIRARLRALRSDLIDPTIAVHNGRIVKRTGDGTVVEFRSVVEAVRCAAEMQNAMIERNAGVPEDRRIVFRIGIHLGDVVEESDGDLMGDGVNIAARLEGIAAPGAICLSEDANRQVKGRLDLAVTDLGQTQLKNIADPIRVYSLPVGVPMASKPKTTPHSERTAPKSRGRLTRWPTIAAAVVVGLLAAGAYAWQSGFATRFLGASVTEDKLKTAPRLSIVVLPFENLSGDPEQEYFADGITDDLTTDLSHVPDSFVISRGTAFTYKGKPIDAKVIGRELGVRHVLEGSVHRVGETVEVNAQLISTETGAHVWADRFEGERANLGKLQFEIVARLANALGEELVKAEALRATRERFNNPDAIDLTMRGTAKLININKSTSSDAISLYERALALDPKNLDANTFLAIVLAVRANNHWTEDPTGETARAEQLLNTASALQPDYTWIHWAQGYIDSIKGQWRPALAEAEIAIAGDRSNARAYGEAGFYKMHLGRSADGIADIETALRLSPHEDAAPIWQARLCYLRAHLAQWEQAIEQCEKAVAANPQGSGIGALSDLAAAYAWAGHDQEAKETAAKLRALDPNWVKFLQTNADSHDNPTYKAEIARIIEGLRKAGMPEE